MVELKINDKYLIDEYGNVYSKYWKKFLNQRESKGYLRVALSFDGEKEARQISVHRLVALQFIPNPENKPHVNHKDNNPKNNHVSNLEWCTQKENVDYSFKHGNRKACPKNWSILSKQINQYDLNHNFLKTWPSTVEIERQLGLYHGGISAACKRKGKCGKYYWEYAETSND